MITPADSAPEPPAQVPASSWNIQAPYDPGQPDPVFVGGDNDAGGTDSVAGDVAGAVAAAEARYREYQSDTYGQGSTYGDLMSLPHSPLDPAVGVLDSPPFEGPYFPETNPA
jgi:hypothetical protein